MLPPSVLQIRIGRFGLWIPLILIWPLAAVLWLLVLPLLLLVAVLTFRWRWVVPMLLLGPALFRLFAAFRGLEVDVQSNSSRVRVTFI